MKWSTALLCSPSSVIVVLHHSHVSPHVHSVSHSAMCHSTFSPLQLESAQSFSVHVRKAILLNFVVSWAVNILPQKEHTLFYIYIYICSMYKHNVVSIKGTKLVWKMLYFIFLFGICIWIVKIHAIWKCLPDKNEKLHWMSVFVWYSSEAAFAPCHTLACRAVVLLATHFHLQKHDKICTKKHQMISQFCIV